MKQFDQKKLIFFSRFTYCAICEKWTDRQILCWHCWLVLQKIDLDDLNIKGFQKNISFLVELQNLFCLFFFEKKHPFSRILYALKYKKRPDLGFLFGKILGFLIPRQNHNTFLVPVPLHKEREKERGYNQSSQIAQGISLATGLPIMEHWVERQINTQTQTQRNISDRLTNTYSIFNILENPPNHAHLILLDDVFTTGSTIEALAMSFLEKNVTLSFSVAVLSYRGKNIF